MRSKQPGIVVRSKHRCSACWAIRLNPVYEGACFSEQSNYIDFMRRKFSFASFHAATSTSIMR
eukprot:1151909-Pelagomonas_calceolata.AAC.3